MATYIKSAEWPAADPEYSAKADNLPGKGGRSRELGPPEERTGLALGIKDGCPRRFETYDRRVMNWSTSTLLMMPTIWLLSTTTPT